VGERGCIDAVYATAIAAYVAGICVIPPKQDGSKSPDVRSWAVYQRRRTTEEEVTTWYTDPRRTGIGYVCGRVSGGLELLDFDDRASAWHAFGHLVADSSLKDVWQRIVAGYWERTPTGGSHVLFRSPRPTGALKLAQRPKRIVERHHERDLWQSLIETKGEGGFTVVAPSHGMVHRSSGAYEMVSGGVTSIVTITAEERDALLAIARMLDQKPRPLYTATAASRRSASDSDKPGDRYNAETSWETLLPAYGWAIDRHHGPTTYWTRPGKDRGVSASTNYQGNDLLWVFTSSTELDPDRSYDRFGFYTVMEHEGNFRAAARALRDQYRGKLASQPSGLRTRSTRLRVREVTHA
jgi:putative DNA primase/helicase